MKKRTIAGTIIAIACTGFIPVPEPADAARPPIVWKVGEYQTAQFDARPGDTVSIFMANLDTPANLAKCQNWGGDGLILTRWRSHKVDGQSTRWWHVCWDVDF
jgi:hypothetical protein